jgi:hypothetical protein
MSGTRPEREQSPRWPLTCPKCRETMGRRAGAGPAAGRPTAASWLCGPSTSRSVSSTFSRFVVIRAEVVAAIASATETNLPAVVEASSPTEAELAAAAEVLSDLAKYELAQAGRLTLSRSVLDMDMAALQVLAAVWAIVGRWWDQSGAPDRLGDLLKIVPADVVHDTFRVLAMGGFVSWADVPEPPSPCDV